MTLEAQMAVGADMDLSKHKPVFVIKRDDKAWKQRTEKCILCTGTVQIRNCFRVRLINVRNKASYPI